LGGLAGLDGFDGNINTSAIVAGLVFGVFGVYLLRWGRQQGNFPHILIGLALLIYPYFVRNDIVLWGLGAFLLFIAYRFR